MKELKVTCVKSTPGFMDDLEVRAYQLQPGDHSDMEMKDGITEEAFHAILDRASQPIEKRKGNKGK